MKKLLVTAIAILFCLCATAQEQPSTFVRHDSTKVLLFAFKDNTYSSFKTVKAYTIFEVRKYDATGQQFGILKGYLDSSKKKFEIKEVFYDEKQFNW